MSQTLPNAFNANCPTRAIVARLAEKWTMLTLAALHQGPMRFGDLRRLIQGVSQKMLTTTLRKLESDGLVVRTDYDEMPLRVEYALTPLGHSCADLVSKVKWWAEKNMLEIEAANRTASDM